MMMDPKLQEYNLALRASEGDADALEQLISMLRVPLFALAYAELQHYEDAQDAVAISVLRICRHISRLKQPERVRSWMNSIVRNEARRFRQSRNAHASTGGLEEASPPAPETLPSILRLDIERALRKVPGDQARVMALFYLVGLSIEQIAQRIGRPEGTIKFWLHQGRQRLTQEMKGYAPMAQNWTAAIVSSEFGSDQIVEMSAALKAAGWDTVNVIREFEAIGRLEQTGEGDSRELHLPKALQGSRCIVLDEWIEGRSAFEILALLNATAERKDVVLCFLAETVERRPNIDITIHAAYAAGVDMFLTKPFQLIDLEKLMRRLRTQLAEQK